MCICQPNPSPSHGSSHPCSHVHFHGMHLHCDAMHASSHLHTMCHSIHACMSISIPNIFIHIHVHGHVYHNHGHPMFKPCLPCISKEMNNTVIVSKINIIYCLLNLEFMRFIKCIKKFENLIASTAMIILGCNCLIRHFMISLISLQCIISLTPHNCL
jgi:hypothetical protein